MENELRRVVDALPGLVWTALPDGDIDFLNQRWSDYTGLSAVDSYGREWESAVHPADLPGLRERWQSIRYRGEPSEMEARLRRFDGEYRRFLFRASPLADASGQIVKWCGLNTEIVGQRSGHPKQSGETRHLSPDLEGQHGAEVLLASEKRFLEMVAGGHSVSAILEALCQLVESTAGGCYCAVVLVDPSGTRLEYVAAPSLPASFICSVVGRPVNADQGPCAMAAYLNEQVIVADVTSETRWASSEWCAIALAHGLRACWTRPISSTAGKILGAFAIYYEEPRTPTPLHQALLEQFTHIAAIAVERAQSDAALKRSEAFLAEAQHLSSTGSFAWRAPTREMTWSEELYRIFDFDPGVRVTTDLIGTRVHVEDFPLFDEMLSRAREDGCDFEHELRLQMPDRSIKHLHMVAHGTRNQHGQLEYIGAIQDVTQRKRSEQALGKVRSELAHMARVTSLGTLAASIAHEVSQPLSGIMTNGSTCLRMLAGDPPNIEGARETARRTVRDGNRAADVIRRLRALFGKKGATIGPIDLNEAAQEVIALSRSELQRNRVIIREEFADDIPSVAGDRIQLQQVILNLLMNASQAMSGINDRPRKLVIGTERDERDQVCLSVRDSGVGIEPEGVDKLFDAFYTTKRDGMGIGLSVSRSIIASHHGRLWAAPNDSAGATFSFSIPCRYGELTDLSALGDSDTWHMQGSMSNP